MKRRAGEMTFDVLEEYIEEGMYNEFVSAIKSNPELLKCKSKSGYNLGLLSAFIGNLEILKYMHKNHRVLCETNDGSLNILFLGAMSGNIEVFEFLMKIYPALLKVKYNDKSILNYVDEYGAGYEMFFAIAKAYPELKNITQNFTELESKMRIEREEDGAGSELTDDDSELADNAMIDFLLEDYIKNVPQQPINKNTAFVNPVILTYRDFPNLEDFSNSNGSVRLNNVNEVKNLALFIASNLKDELAAKNISIFHIWLSNLLLTQFSNYIVDLALKDKMIGWFRDAINSADVNTSLCNAIMQCFPRISVNPIENTNLAIALKQNSVLLAAVDGNGNNIAHKAAFLGRIDLLDYLSSAYPNLLKQKNSFGENVMFLAAMSGSVETFDYMVDKFPEQIIERVSGKTILGLLAEKSKYKMFEHIANKYPGLPSLTEEYTTLAMAMSLLRRDAEVAEQDRTRLLNSSGVKKKLKVAFLDNADATVAAPCTLDSKNNGAGAVCAAYFANQSATHKDRAFNK